MSPEAQQDYTMALSLWDVDRVIARQLLHQVLRMLPLIPYRTRIELRTCIKCHNLLRFNTIMEGMGYVVTDEPRINRDFGPDYVFSHGEQCF